MALTRAKEKLILTGMIDKPEKKLAMLIPIAMRGFGRLMYGELAGAGSYLDFLLPALCVHPAMNPFGSRVAWKYQKNRKTHGSGRHK